MSKKSSINFRRKMCVSDIFLRGGGTQLVLSYISFFSLFFFFLIIVTGCFTAGDVQSRFVSYCWYFCPTDLWICPPWRGKEKEKLQAEGKRRSVETRPAPIPADNSQSILHEISRPCLSTGRVHTVYAFECARHCTWQRCTQQTRLRTRFHAHRRIRIFPD